METCVSIARRLSEIQAVVNAAAARASRKPGDVRILAVSKIQPIALIEECYSLGLRDFGENYVQELVEKRRLLAHLKDIRWHLIGHLQTNKAKQVVNEADCFHALDSEKLLRELARRAERVLPVFIEVNIDDEPSKAGVPPAVVEALVQAVRAEPKLKLEGLMCIPEAKSDPEMMRPAFRRMSALARKVEQTHPLLLSMGMSSDFEVAVEEGANWVRVGAKLFGERPQRG
ncbi:MAG: YggS family pyridoxal phosphate-dependent enzyme [Deltaproteobacteria bacterium]|nr:YggS family pyridoxal phosphate-dependent enzyme [Deltaproteobacteria bacterium]